MRRSGNRKAEHDHRHNQCCPGYGQRPAQCLRVQDARKNERPNHGDNQPECQRTEIPRPRSIPGRGREAIHLEHGSDDRAHGEEGTKEKRYGET